MSTSRSLSTTTVEVHRVEKIPAEADIVGWDVLAAPETLNQFSDWIPAVAAHRAGRRGAGHHPGRGRGPEPA